MVGLLFGMAHAGFYSVTRGVGTMVEMGTTDGEFPVTVVEAGAIAGEVLGGDPN